MRKLSSLIAGASLTLTAGLFGCVEVDDPLDTFNPTTQPTTQANEEETGDGDGDETPGDGDGDGDETPGDGDGDGDCGDFGQACCDGTTCNATLSCQPDGTCGLGGGDGDGDGDGDADFPDAGPNGECPPTYFPDSQTGKCLPPCNPQDPQNANACPAGSQCAVAVYGYRITNESCTTAADCVNGLQPDCLNAGGNMVCVYFQTACTDDSECTGLQGTNPNEGPACWPLQGGDSCATLHCTYPG